MVVGEDLLFGSTDPVLYFIQINKTMIAIKSKIDKWKITYEYLWLPGTYEYLQVPTCIYVYLRVPKSIYDYLPLPTRTCDSLRVPKSTYEYLQLHTSIYK